MRGTLALKQFLDVHGTGLYPAKLPPFDSEDGGVPPEMWDGEPDADGYVQWRSTPSPVTSAQLDLLEAEFHVRFPRLFRHYLSSRCILSVEGYGLPEIPADCPLGPLRAHLRSWAPLHEAGYVSYAEYGDSYGPLCFDLRSDEDIDRVSVVWFDHERLHQLGVERWGHRDAVGPLSTPIYENFEQQLQDAVGGV